ncbi:uncharacterized protein LOC119402282 isoform X11 [Rhipicephalus sanguineus]|uniref:uncharacterized protein LOC119402282 isoform X11 n=1 Tax=Rhipicephalus sanguineus TaxID=34632 RepID=UPI001894A834|nr:uncharacterized protein LOC119402282 isoform X11 [Rhipicephalus sanguineus]
MVSMVPYSLWLFVLIAIGIPPHLATQRKDAGSAPNARRKTWPLKFMTSRIIYLNLTTLEYPDITCIKEYRVTWNHIARILTKRVVVKFSSEKWEWKDVDYKAEERKPAKIFTYVENSQSATYTIKFHYTLEYCAIVKTRKETKGGHREGWELWVNEDFFLRNPEDKSFCKIIYEHFSKRERSKQYKLQNCEYSRYKHTLLV